MSVTRAKTSDVVAALAAALNGVAGLRVYPYVADTFRPPGVVIGQPEKDYADDSAPFCVAAWRFTLAIVATRSSDRDAQEQLADLEDAVALALSEAEAPALFSVEPQQSYPAPITVNGQELPGYVMRVLVRA